jgi:hypothetical protein
MGDFSSKVQLIRLVNLDWLIQRNAVFLAMAEVAIGTELPEKALDASEFSRYTELVALQTHLMFERGLVRMALVGAPASEATPVPSA